jgi:uncharacterized protein YqeY
MLREQIYADYMTAFKERDTVKKNLLSVVKGEIQTLEKNLGVDMLSDDEVIKILNKVAKSLREVLITDNANVISDVRVELNIIEVYLPKQMSDDEIKNKIQDLIKGGCSNIAEVMRAFSTLPADRKQVSQIYQTLK